MIPYVIIFSFLISTMIENPESITRTLPPSTAFGVLVDAAWTEETGALGVLDAFDAADTLGPVALVQPETATSPPRQAKAMTSISLASGPEPRPT
jgi:hypothetical protein